MYIVVQLIIILINETGNKHINGLIQSNENILENLSPIDKSNVR